MVPRSIRVGHGTNSGSLHARSWATDTRGQDVNQGRIFSRSGIRKGWTEKDLQERRKGDEFKVRLAAQLRAETTVTLRWIAARLCIGTRGHLIHLLYRQNREKSPKQQSRRLKI